MPIDNTDLIWFTDGPYLRDELGNYCPGYAITPLADVIESSCLQGIKSAQQAELLALTWACPLDKDLTANIYTDYCYAFGVAHDFGMLWEQ